MTGASSPSPLALKILQDMNERNVVLVRGAEADGRDQVLDAAEAIDSHLAPLLEALAIGLADLERVESRPGAVPNAISVLRDALATVKERDAVLQEMHDKQTRKIAEKASIADALLDCMCEQSPGFWVVKGYRRRDYLAAMTALAKLGGV